ncbi:hypothetical protein BGV63_29500 [Burkholderia ubonensis]|nr:hypothetical protein WJ65_19910 [Burkholderia ubonensis]KVP10113.1 hypothetical protein WJ84_23635 [Burkholderia ubonensis]KWI23646.1 hypothetical protein WM02_29300 [Burkholderia ubonensis]ODQ24035.1 hypothetical protein BGV63_29500 [Burkholderia ubonensis]
MTETKASANENGGQKYADAVCPCGSRNDAIELSNRKDDLVRRSSVDLRPFMQLYLLRTTMAPPTLPLCPGPAEPYLDEVQLIKRVSDALKGNVDGIPR